MFLLGVAQILWLPQVDDLLLWVIALIILACSILRIRYSNLTSMLFFLSGMLYSLTVCQIQSQSELTFVQQDHFQGRIESLPKHSATKVSFISTHPGTQQKFLLNWYKNNNTSSPDFMAGGLYQFEVKLKPPHGMVNGVGFDREKWLFRNRIDGIGTIQSMQLIEPPKLLSMHALNLWRAQTSDFIDSAFTNPRVNGLIHALSIGDKSHFEHQDFQLFQNTGTAHLIAISGLHIGMVAALGWIIGGLLFKLFPQQRIPRPLIQLAFSLVLATIYAALAGFAVSTLRALIMLVVLSIFKVLRRPGFAWDVWSVSLMVVLLLDPLNVLDAGFWLSFTAVAVLILTFSGVSNTNNSFTDFFVMQWRLLLGMLPLSLLVFAKINLFAPLINLVMIPLMTFLIVPLIMLMLFVSMAFNSAPDLLIDLLSASCQFFIDTLSWFELHTASPINLKATTTWQTILLITGTCIMILPKAIPQRFWGLVLVLMAVTPIKSTSTKGHFKAYFLDVGQGLSVVIRTENHTFIYDVGAAYDSGFNMADAHIIPFLKHHNINHLDGLMLSHQDNDHAGAAKFLSQKMPIKETWGTHADHKPCIAGTQWQWDGIQFNIISPYNLTPYLKNNSSCVLKISNKEHSLLLTGDIESPVEYRLSQFDSAFIQSDVLLVPHHGSNTSSTDIFINAVKPQLAINSSGKYNPFGHPTQAVRQAYDQQHIPFIDTQNSGMITLHTYPQLHFQLLRSEAPKIWRKKSPNKSGF